MEERIRCRPLRKKITDPATAAKIIRDGTNLFISGFSAGYPKLIPTELVRRAAGGQSRGTLQGQSFCGRLHRRSGRRQPGRSRSDSLATPLHERPNHAPADQRGKNPVQR